METKYAYAYLLVYAAVSSPHAFAKDRRSLVFWLAVFFSNHHGFSSPFQRSVRGRAINSAESSGAADRKPIPAFQIDNHRLPRLAAHTFVLRHSSVVRPGIGVTRSRDTYLSRTILWLRAEKRNDAERGSYRREFRAWGRSVTPVAALSSGSVGRRTTEHFAPLSL